MQPRKIMILTCVILILPTSSFIVDGRVFCCTTTFSSRLIFRPPPAEPSAAESATAAAPTAAPPRLPQPRELAARFLQPAAGAISKAAESCCTAAASAASPSARGSVATICTYVLPVRIVHVDRVAVHIGIAVVVVGVIAVTVITVVITVVMGRSRSVIAAVPGAVP